MFRLSYICEGAYDVILNKENSKSYHIVWLEETVLTLTAMWSQRSNLLIIITLLICPFNGFR